jgi:hypothetical protein
MVDMWMIFTMMIPFAEVTLYAAREKLRTVSIRKQASTVEKGTVPLLSYVGEEKIETQEAAKRSFIPGRYLQIYLPCSNNGLEAF